MVVGTNKNGKMQFYDVVNIKPTSFEIKETGEPSYRYGQTNDLAIANSPVSDNVPQSTENVKKKFSFNEPVEETELTATEREAQADREELINTILKHSKEVESAYRQLMKMDAANEALGEVMGERRAERVLWSAKKERTDNWLRVNRLSLPLLATNIGSDKTISQSK